MKRNLIPFVRIKDKLRFLSVCCFYLFLFTAQAFTQTNVSGVVKDTNGEPLIGVNVTVKNTAQRAVTNFDGIFNVNVPSLNAILEFSYIGFQSQEFALQGKTEITIIMLEDTRALDEVIVVGYGTQKKSTLTGSVAQIDTKQIQQAPTGNISNILAGRIAGLTAVQRSGMPGRDDAALMVRGISTLGSSAPMVVVDGIPRSFNNLDPNEIQSISILKDASAAAVYGMQAANGVILVTTKQGSEKAPSITYSASFGMDKNTRFPKFLNGPQFAYYWNKALELDNIAPAFTESMYNDIQAGRNGFGNTDWFEQIFQTGHSQHHNVSVDGGTKNTKYFISAGYFDQIGNIRAFGFHRYNFRSNISTKIGNQLTVGLNLGGRQENRKNPNVGEGEVVFQAARMFPYLPTKVDGMDVAAVPLFTLINPVASLNNGGSSTNQTNFIQSNLSLKWDVPFIKGLNLNSVLSYDNEYTTFSRFSTPYKMMRAVLDYNKVTYSAQNAPAGFQDPETGIYESALEEAFGNGVRATGQFSVNYANTFGDHDIGGLLLYEYSNFKTRGFGLTAQGFEFPDIQTLNLADKIINRANPYYGVSSEVPRAGYVGRFTYGYKGKYLAELSGRYDGSYKFSPENRWDFFPAVSVGWRISEEDFFREWAPQVDNLKFRASWGKLGSDANVGSFQFYKYIAPISKDPIVVIGGTPQKGYMTSGIPNPELTWEVATSYNAGFDLNMWQGLLGVEFDYFYKITDNILASQSGNFPASVGNYFPAIINFGIVDNRGFDLALTSNARFGEVDFGVRGSLNWAKNKIIRYSNPDIAYYQRSIGRSMGEKEGFISMGLFQSQEEVDSSPLVDSRTLPGDIIFKDLNGDGIVDYDQDRTWIGRSSIPEMMFGLNLTLGWRGIDFSALLQGAALSDQALMGNYPGIGWDDTQFTRTFYGGGNSPLHLVQNSWTPDNPNALYPRLSTKYRNNGYASDFWLFDGTYLRLKNLQIGYSIPESLIKYIGAKKLRIYATGQNLLTFSHNPFLDPEAPDVSNGYYPQQKNYTVGLQITF